MKNFFSNNKFGGLAGEIFENQLKYDRFRLGGKG